MVHTPLIMSWFPRTFLSTYFPFDKTVLQSALSRKTPGSHHRSDKPDLALAVRTLQFCYSALISPLNFCFLYCCQHPNALSSMLQKGSSMNISAAEIYFVISIMQQQTLEKASRASDTFTSRSGSKPQVQAWTNCLKRFLAPD